MWHWKIIFDIDFVVLGFSFLNCVLRSISLGLCHSLFLRFCGLCIIQWRYSRSNFSIQSRGGHKLRCLRWSNIKRYIYPTCVISIYFGFILSLLGQNTSISYNFRFWWNRRHAAILIITIPTRWRSFLINARIYLRRCLLTLKFLRVPHNIFKSVIVYFSLLSIIKKLFIFAFRCQGSHHFGFFRLIATLVDRCL